MVAILKLSTIRFSLILLIVVTFSCKQTVTSTKELAYTEKQEIKVDSLDVKVKELMVKHKIPGVNIALIRNGRLSSTRNYGILQVGKKDSINDETMYSVGSISKVVNAILILKLVKEGRLDLDKNINDYLLGWKVQENKYTRDNPVTLRKILSHTAGFSVHGFQDYLPQEEIPNTIQILKGERPAKNEKVEVIYQVGGKSQYSGGGITVSQKIIEDITGLTYAEAARQLLFVPLNLKRSSYENPLPASFKNIAKAHDENGSPTALPRGYETMPEQAASGLWTTPRNLAKLLSVFIPSNEGETEGFLSSVLINDMVTNQPNSQWGLGPQILNHKGYKLIEHGGANDSYKAIFCIYPEKNVGYIVFANGSNGMGLITEALPFLDEHFNISTNQE